MFDSANLRVLAASPRHLLAMKAMAARQQDMADLAILIRLLGLRTADEVSRSRPRCSQTTAQRTLLTR